MGCLRWLKPARSDLLVFGVDDVVLSAARRRRLRSGARPRARVRVRRCTGARAGRLVQLLRGAVAGLLEPLGGGLHLLGAALLADLVDLLDGVLDLRDGAGRELVLVVLDQLLH